MMLLNATEMNKCIFRGSNSAIFDLATLVSGVQLLLKMQILPLTLTTVKILKIGTPEIITIIVLQLEQLDFTVQYCVQKMQTE